MYFVPTRLHRDRSRQAVLIFESKMLQQPSSSRVIRVFLFEESPPGRDGYRAGPEREPRGRMKLPYKNKFSEIPFLSRAAD
jgi:hypothetical protein